MVYIRWNLSPEISNHFRRLSRGHLGRPTAHEPDTIDKGLTRTTAHETNKTNK